MSKSNYAGLDYSGPGSTVNRDPETGIRYGVISQHSIQSDVMSDIWSEARDLSYEQAVEEMLHAGHGFFTFAIIDVEDGALERLRRVDAQRGGVGEAEVGQEQDSHG